MATIRVLIVEAAINALAFSGTNFLFSKRLGYGEEERKGHDKAVEQLEAAQAQWIKARQAKLDWFYEERERQTKAGTDLSELEDSMRLYFIATLDKAPNLSYLYVPSEKQKNGELTFIVESLALLATRRQSAL